jgi:hypothetical protein
MPKRPNQIIPVSLFHSTSAGDLAIVTLNPVSQAHALPKFSLPRFSWHLEIHHRNTEFKAFHLSLVESSSPVTPLAHSPAVPYSQPIITAQYRSPSETIQPDTVAAVCPEYNVRRPGARGQQNPAHQWRHRDLNDPHFEPEFPIWASVSRIVCFSCQGHNEFAARADPSEVSGLPGLVPNFRIADNPGVIACWRAMFFVSIWMDVDILHP